MANLWFTSDVHLGHRAIAKYRPQVSDCDDNTRQFLDFYGKNVRNKHAKDKADIIYFMGDTAFDSAHNSIIGKLPGRKFLMRGNHDYVPMSELCDTYEEIHGLLKKYHMWLSHCPIHPQELRGNINLHGHVHEKTVVKGPNNRKWVDPSYINLSWDALMLNFGKPMIDIQQLREYIKMAEDGKVKIAPHKDYTHIPTK